MAILKQLAAPAHAPDTLRPCASRRSKRGPNTARPIQQRSWNSCHAEIAVFSCVPVGLAFGIADQRSLRDLTCEAIASRSSSVLGPLGRSAEQRGPQADQGGRMFERSEFPAAPLADRDGRASAQSADARQGVLFLCLLSFGQAKESESHNSAKPQVKIHPTVDPTLVIADYVSPALQSE